MIKNKAIEVISTFSEPELKLFYLFLESPYFNSNKSLIKLFGVIKKSLQQKKAEKLNEENLYSKIFKGKKYNYGIMKNLLSELFKLCEKFLAVNQPEDGPNIEFEESLRRLKNYSFRQLDKLFFAEYKKTESKMEYSVLSTDYYRNRFRLVETLYKFYTRRSNYVKGADTLYPMAIYNTCSMFASFKQDIAGIDYMQGQVNRKPEVNITNALYKNLDINKFLKEIEGLEKEHYEYIQMQAGLIRLYTEPGDMDNYQNMREFIFGNIEKFSNAERWLLSSALFTFILNKYISSSSSALLAEIAELRKTQLKYVEFDKGGLGPMQSGVFRNIIELFVVLGDIDYAAEVIEKFVPQLEASKRTACKAYALALIEESRGNNEKVLQLIKNVDFNDPQAKYSVKMVALVAYYALGYIEEGLSSCDAMKHFIKDTKEFSAPMKQHLLERASVIEKLFKIKANPEKYSAADIEEFEQSNKIHFAARREWFLAKTAELKKLVR